MIRLGHVQTVNFDVKLRLVALQFQRGAKDVVVFFEAVLFSLRRLRTAVAQLVHLKT